MDRSDEQVPHVPFRPDARGTVSHRTPSTVPGGVRMESSRARIRPGQHDVVGRWMQMMIDRYQESVAVLPTERSAFEAIPRPVEADGSTWIHHLAVVGEDGSGHEETDSIDADHAAFSREVEESGREEPEPRSMLAPDRIRPATAGRARTGRAG